MPRILNVQSSLNIESSASRSASKVYIDRYVAANPDSVVVDLDLVANPPSHLSTHHLAGLFGPPPHAPESAEALKTSEAYLQQLFDSDVIVVATPMHNLGISSTLKSWIDNLVRRGRTFIFDENGQAIGLVPSSKRLVIVVASGGIYSAGPMAVVDHASSYIKDVFNFMGVSDVSIVRAEGQTMGPDMATKGLANAWAEAQALADRHSGVADKAAEPPASAVA